MNSGDSLEASAIETDSKSSSENFIRIALRVCSLFRRIQHFAMQWYYEPLLTRPNGVRITMVRMWNANAICSQYKFQNKYANISSS